MLKLIACIDEKNGIGKNNSIPWSNKEELNHFRNMTLNHMVVMGHNTYKSLNKPLSDRINVVLSKNPYLKIDNVQVVNDYRIILDYAKTNDVYVIGGSEIYKLFEPYYDELIISKINGDYECDAKLKINYSFFNLEKTETFDTYSVNYYSSYKNKIMFGNVVAEKIKNNLIEYVEELIARYKKTPQLAIVKVGNDYASSVYVKNKIKLAQELKLDYKLIELDECTTTEQLIKEIKKLNKSKRVNGILVQLPLPKQIDEQTIINSINPEKDVDCFHPINVGKLWTNPDEKDLLLPCTPNGIMSLLDYYNIDLTSKNVVVVGRSNIVSKPLAALLLAKNATVTICHSKTNNLVEITKHADIVISAIGKSNFFNKAYFKENCIIVDVGINRDENNKLTGDVDFNDVLKHVQKITPVPYGVGSMTIISLLKNLLICYCKQNKIS